MPVEKVLKALANCEQNLSETEKAQCRVNIGAQGALTAGNNITIEDGVISATDTTYTAGANVSISNQNVISATDTTYSAGAGLNLNGTEFSVDTNTIQSKLSAGSNITISGNTISATDTTYNVFNTTTDGLVPKASGTGDTGKFLKGDGTWEAINTTVNATAPLYGTGTQADPLNLRVSHGLSVVQPSGGNTYLQVTHPVPAPGSTSAGKVLTCTDTLENLSWQTPATATGVQEIVTTSSTYAEVTAINTAGNEPVLYVADSNGAGYFRRVFTGVVSTTPSPISAVKFARLAGSVFEMYTIDSDTGNWVYSSVPLTKHRHDAELYFYNTDDGDHYHVRGIQNYAVNHVAVQNHSGDICSVTIEAPTLGLNEEYDYVVVFDCTNSSGSCNVSVQGCDAEIDTKWEVDPNATPIKTYAIDITNTLVGFSGSPQYQIEVLGNRWHLHRF